MSDYQSKGAMGSISAREMKYLSIHLNTLFNLAKPAKIWCCLHGTKGPKNSSSVSVDAYYKQQAIYYNHTDFTHILPGHGIIEDCCASMEMLPLFLTEDYSIGCKFFPFGIDNLFRMCCGHSLKVILLIIQNLFCKQTEEYFPLSFVIGWSRSLPAAKPGSSFS